RANPDERPPSIAALLDELDRDPHRVRRRGAVAAAAAVAIGGAGLAGWQLVAARAPSAAPACAPLASDAADVYVDAPAASIGTGTARCPLRTVTAALATVSTSQHRTIHIAAGTYDHALGERFPIVVRGDVALVGAGESATRIVGTGKLDHTAAGGGFDHPFSAAMVIGDARAQVAIADLTVAGEAAPEMEVHGVVCDRGTMDSFDGPLPPANTHLSRLTLGPGFDAALVVGTSAHPDPSGCN